MTNRRDRFWSECVVHALPTEEAYSKPDQKKEHDYRRHKENLWFLDPYQLPSIRPAFRTLDVVTYSYMT